MVKTFSRLSGDKTSKQGIERDMINTALSTDWTHLQRSISDAPQPKEAQDAWRRGLAEGEIEKGGMSHLKSFM